MKGSQALVMKGSQALVIPDSGSQALVMKGSCHPWFRLGELKLKIPQDYDYLMDVIFYLWETCNCRRATIINFAINSNWKRKLDSVPPVFLKRERLSECSHPRGKILIRNCFSHESILSPISVSHESTIIFLPNFPWFSV